MRLLLKMMFLLILSVGFIAEGGGKGADPSVEDLIKEADAIVADGKGEVLERLHKLHAKYEGFGFSGFVPTEDNNEQIADVLIQYDVWNQVWVQVGEVEYQVFAQLREAIGQIPQSLHDKILEQVYIQVDSQVKVQAWGQIDKYFEALETSRSFWERFINASGLENIRIKMVNIEERLEKFDFASAYRKGKLQDLVKWAVCYRFLIFNYLVRPFILEPSLRGRIAGLIEDKCLKCDFEKLIGILDESTKYAKEAGNPVLVTHLKTFKFVLPRSKNM